MIADMPQSQREDRLGETTRILHSVPQDELKAATELLYAELHPE